MKLDILEERIAQEQYETQKWKAIADERWALLWRVKELMEANPNAYVSDIYEVIGNALERELADG